MNTPRILITEPSADYELMDSGEGEKLERFGKIVLSRPDPQALWRKRLDVSVWRKADGSFTREEKKGDWSLKKGMEEKWNIDFGGLKMWVKPTAFKHVGLFPEHAPNWDWMRDTIKRSLTKGTRADTSSRKAESATSEAHEADRGDGVSSGSEVEILNLFGYTGGASLACAQAGAKVVHVDGSKAALAWARENAESSGLGTKPIRWILDDAREFVRREVKRGRKYAGIIMDPPAFGHGSDNQLWKIEEHFLLLVEACMSILADKPLFFIINGYSAGYSAIAYQNNLLPLIKKYGGSVGLGELAIEESGEAPRLLPCGIFARWEA